MERSRSQPKPQLFALQPAPRLLGAQQAAGYLGISARSFDKLWRAGKVVLPHRIGRRLLWDRVLLDAFVDRLSGIDMQPSEHQDPW